MEGGRLLATLKKTEKAAQDELKVLMESWTLHGPRINKLIFDGEIGYGWAVLNATDLQLE